MNKNTGLEGNRATKTLWVMIILGLFIILSSSVNISASTWGTGVPKLCYQETANASTASDGTCGLNYTGVYGNGTDAAYGIIWMNYTKPYQATSNSLWQVKIGDIATANYSIPSDCWNSFSNKLVLRLASKIDLGQLKSWAQCYNSSDGAYDNVAVDLSGTYNTFNQILSPAVAYDGNWSSYIFYGSGNQWGINFTFTHGLYEEAMIWNITNSSVTLNSPVDYYNSSSNVLFTCSANVVGSTLANISFIDNGIITSTINHNGLVAYYTLDNNLTNDYFGVSNLTRGTTIVNGTGKIFGGFDWNRGSDDFLRATFPNSTNQMPSFTWGMWLKLNDNSSSSAGSGSGGYSVLISQRDTSQNKMTYAVFTNSSDQTYFGRLYMVLYNTVGGTKASYSEAVINQTGIWYHIVVSYNGTANNLTFYINGIQQGLSTGVSLGTTLITNYFGKTDFGRQTIGTNRYLNGSLDDIRLYNRTLSSAEVFSLYNSGLAGLEYLPASSTESFNQTFASSETHNWTCMACDSEGVCNLAENRTITIDMTAPTISIVQPTSSVYDYRNVSLNYSIVDSGVGGGSCWYSLNGNANVSLPSCANASILLNTRNNILIVYANDSLGNTGVSSTIYPYYFPLLQICNATSTMAYINFTFKNETTLAPYITASFVSSWVYWFDVGTSRSLSLSNVTENSQYTFCIDGQNKTLYASPTIQYYNTDSPSRNYIPGTLTLTNTTTQQVLYLLPTSAGLYVTFQVWNTISSPIQNAYVNASRAGVLYASGLTDGAGTTLFFLNPLYEYTICAAKTGYTTLCSAITPTQPLYTLVLSSTSATNGTYISSIEGISWTRTPHNGVISSGLTFFDFNVTAENGNLFNCTFQLLNQTKDILQSNFSIAMTPYNCYGNLTRNVVWGETLYGRYYVDLGNGSIMIESDGNWYTLYNASAVSPMSLKNLLSYLGDATVWGASAPEDEKIYEFTKFMFFFIIVAIVAAWLNLRTNFDITSPGYFLLGFPLIAWFLSLGGMVAGANSFLYIQGATPFNFTDNIIVALWTTLIAVALYIRRQRGLQS